MKERAKVGRKKIDRCRMNEVDIKTKTHIIKGRVKKKMVRYQHMTLGRQQRLNVKMMQAKRLLPAVQAELDNQKIRNVCVQDVATKDQLKDLAEREGYLCCVLGHRLDLVHTNKFNYISHDHRIPLAEAKQFKGAFSI